MPFSSWLSTALALAPAANAFMRMPGLNPRHMYEGAPGVSTIKAPNGATIRYTEPGKQGVCETTPGVNSYSGYIDVGPNMHTFFWFFESRNDPANDQISLWLNGGPGSDSLIGLFQELGPCMIAENLTSYINPYGWNEASNLLFLSQPFGTGFSYDELEEGSLDPFDGGFLNATQAPPDGLWPVFDPAIDTTDKAAVAAYHVLQGFYSALPQLDSEVKSKTFNLWTESYGGHYGPAFFDYFYDQNLMIANGSMSGVELSMNTLGIGNGIINEYIQAQYYPEFAVNNTYGIKAYNDTVYNYATFANWMINGCRDQITSCDYTNKTSFNDYVVCSEAADMCRDNVESPYYSYGDRGTYDIRISSEITDPPNYFVDYLNDPSIQAAIGTQVNGTNTNYTSSNSDVYWHFQSTGDFVYDNFLEDLDYLLGQGVRVSLYYGDADYICNWFGGEAISLNVNYTHSEEFRNTDYELMMVDGEAYGEVRQYGNFSFTRVWEAGHLVPYYQPAAALALFNRTINHMDVATGTKMVTTDYQTSGEGLNATHTEPYVAVSTSMMASSASLPAAAASSSMAAPMPKKVPILPRDAPTKPKKANFPRAAPMMSFRGTKALSDRETLERRRPGYGIGQKFSKNWRL